MIARLPMSVRLFFAVLVTVAVLDGVAAACDDKTNDDYRNWHTVVTP